MEIRSLLIWFWSFTSGFGDALRSNENRGVNGKIRQ